MTKEEYENLKVGDVVKFYDETGSDWDIEKVIFIHEDSDGLKVEVKVLETSRDDTSNYTYNSNECKYIELLPLYNSPLYKAMSEADAPNEKSEEE